MKNSITRHVGFIIYIINPKKILVVRSHINWWSFPKGARECADICCA